VVPPEEPLGYDINEVAIVGGQFEIERSLAGGDERSIAAVSHDDVEPLPASTSKPKGGCDE
jgi:hypothetical protein